MFQTILSKGLLGGLLFFCCTALPALEIGGIQIDDHDQRVDVKVSKSGWRASKDGTSIFIPILNVSFSTGNFIYTLRHDGGGPYQNGIGISHPSQSNWYQCDSFALIINGTRFATGAGSNEKFGSSEEGKRGDAVYQWNNEIATVSYNFNAHFLDRNLYLIIQIEPHCEITSLAVNLNAFPGGFLHKNQQKKLQVLGRDNHFTLEPRGVRELPPQSTDFVFLYRAEELAAEGYRGGCGVIFTGQAAKKIKVTNGFYSQVILEFPPGTRQIKLALNEMTSPNPADQFIKQYPVAAERLPTLKFKPLPND